MHPAAGARQPSADRQAVLTAAQRLHVRALPNLLQAYPPACPLFPAVLIDSPIPLPCMSLIDGMRCRLHGLAHIELNAIDLALDTVARFSSLPLGRVRAVHPPRAHNHVYGHRLHILLPRRSVTEGQALLAIARQCEACRLCMSMTMTVHYCAGVLRRLRKDSGRREPAFRLVLAAAARARLRVRLHAGARPAVAGRAALERCGAYATSPR